MTEKEINEGNRIIAEWMKHKEGYDEHGVWQKLKYHTDWNWLMEVVEKICRTKMGDGVKYVEYAYPRTFGMISSETGKIMVRLNGFSCFDADTLIEATWLACVDFINWHNQTTTDKGRGE